MSDSTPVVLLHAGVCDRRMWDDVTPGLRDALRPVVAPDLRGFGSRPLGLAPFSHAGDVLSLMDGLGADKVDLAGASFGGQVALQVASLAPERVRSLVLLAAALPEWDWSDPELIAYGEAEEAAINRGDVDGAVDLNVRMWAGEASPSVQEYVAEAQRRAFELGGEGADEQEVPVDLGAIRARTLVMVGDRDVSDFMAIGEHLASTLPSAELRVVEGAGHLLALERPDEVRDALVAWVHAEE
ncbi:MAG TPA: alpha/beta hydrolase [Solirubrobacteraceae bacterium]|nr:alpha/beta hydrolase [Solirubrobacteraceae bacterium]